MNSLFRLVRSAGFRSYELKGLVLLVNTPATANVRLKVGAAAELVTVTSEIPAVDLVDASLCNSFDERQVRQVPLESCNSRCDMTFRRMLSSLHSLVG